MSGADPADGIGSGGVGSGGVGSAGGGFGQVFRVPAFRAIWAAELFSVAGDQVARVALAVLVYGRTGSAAWAATTYALTFLPALVGGVLLAGLADRFPRRDVIIVSDLLRAVLVAVMAIPQLPLWLLCGILVVVVLLHSPHSAAQGALMPEILRGRLYERGLAVRQMTAQTAQLVGFAGGGLLVAAISPSVALLVDAATFALSAVLIRSGVPDRSRPVPDGAHHPAGGYRAVVRGIVDIAADPRRRALVLLAWLVGCYVVPEALAAPYAAEIGAGPSVVGVMMAADPLGSVIGAWLFMRFVPPDVRERIVGVLALAAGLPLMLMFLRPEVPVTLLLWGVSGMFSAAYLLQTQASFVRATPDAGRGRAIGVAASGIIAGQGVAVFLGGLLADLWSPSTAIVIFGAIGALLALGGTVAWARAAGGRDSSVAIWAHADATSSPSGS